MSDVMQPSEHRIPDSPYTTALVHGYVTQSLQEIEELYTQLLGESDSALGVEILDGILGMWYDQPTDQDRKDLMLSFIARCVSETPDPGCEKYCPCAAVVINPTPHNRYAPRSQFFRFPVEDIREDLRPHYRIIARAAYMCSRPQDCLEKLADTIKLQPVSEDDFIRPFFEVDLAGWRDSLDNILDSLWRAHDCPEDFFAHALRLAGCRSVTLPSRLPRPSHLFQSSPSSNSDQTSTTQ